MRFVAPAGSALLALLLLWGGFRFVFLSPFLGAVVLALGVFLAVLSIRLTRAVRMREPTANWAKHPGFRRYLLCVGIVAAVAWIIIAVTMLEIVPMNDTVDIVLSFVAGPPAVAMTMITAGVSGDAVWVRLVAASIICSLYFFLLGVPAGKALGLLPARESVSQLWSVQAVLIGFHLLFAVFFLQMLKA